MDRKQLTQLFREGMRYPQGKHRVTVSRIFEITVHPDSRVQLDEYEGFAVKDRAIEKHPKNSAEMFHLGRTVLHLKEDHVVEEPGSGWGKPDR